MGLRLFASAGDNRRVDASTPPAAAQPPDPDPRGDGPRNTPLTVCPTPDPPARPALRDGAPGEAGPKASASPGEGTSRVHQPHDHGSVLEHRPGRVRRLGTPFGILAAVTGAFAYVGTVDPNEPGHYPVCPLLQLTGVLCPGCGGLRSAHAFITGDLGGALSANAIATVGYVLFAGVWALWLVRAWRGQPLRIALAPAWWWGVGAVLLVFTVVRNLPFGSALAP